MCGRYALRTSVPELARTLGVEPLVDFVPRFNIAPTQQVPAMHITGAQRALRWMRWGLVPSWSAGPDARYAMHNARIENITAKPAYRGPLRRQRCLIPASGWYEWQKLKDRKQPWLIAHSEAPLVCLAAVWDHWQSDSESITSCSLLTASAAAPIDDIHNRMPIVVPMQRWESWLNPTNHDPNAALNVLQPIDALALRATAVSSHVNNARNDDPRCMEELQEPEA
jgi:putative SOS response-associated peptidase YedK